MSKLGEMIARLCPNGVEYKKLGEVAEIGTGSSNRNESSVDGQYPFFVRSKQIERMDSYEFDEEAIIIPGEGGIGEIFHYVNGKYALHQRVYRIHLLRDDICAMFVYYYLTAHFKQFILSKAVTATVTSIRKPMIEKFSIPLPPLPIQREIVQTLDNFANLTAELTAELAKRKKQYEHYRDMLLNFTGGGRYDKFGVESGEFRVEWKRLGEIAEIGTGSSNTDEQLDEGKYPFFVRSQDVRWKNEYEYDETAIITSGDGVGVGKIFHYHEGKYALHQRAYRVHVFVDQVLPKYIFYYMKNGFLSYIQKNAFQSSVTSIRKPMLLNFPIPLPPLAEQERIVAILDRFDSLCNSLTEGLPAEIALRKKQYEYYRDKLLSFKEAS